MFSLSLSQWPNAATMGAAAPAVGGASASPGANFMRDTVLKSPQLGVTNSTKMTFVFSIYNTAYTGAASNNTIAGQGNMQSDPNSFYEVTGGISPGIAIAYENTGIAQWSFNNSLGATVGTDDIKFEFAAPNTAYFTPSAWNTYLITFDSATGDWACYWADGSQADMVDLRAAGIVAAASLPTNCLCDLNNTNGLMISGGSVYRGGPGANGAMDSVYIAAGECLSNGSGAVTTANLRKFYNAGLVQDLSGYPTGRQPEVLVTFDPSTGAVVNHGTGSAFAVHTSNYQDNVATNDGYTGHEIIGLTRSDWGPGQVEPSTPHYRFTLEGDGLGQNKATNSTYIIQPQGHKIRVGDVLVYAASIQDRNGAYNHNITLPSALKTAAGANQPNSWSSTTGGNLWPGSDFVSFNGGVKIADAADVRMADSYAGRDATLVATSTTSITIPGAPSLPNSGAAFDITTQSGKGFVAGDVVEVWGNNATNDRGNRFWAVVNSYSSTTLNVTPICSQGSVTSYTHWTINLGGWRWSWTMDPTFANNGGSIQCGQAFIHVYGGVGTVGASGHATAGWAAPGQITTGGVTTTHANALVVSIFMAADPGAHLTPHTGATYKPRYRTLKRTTTVGNGAACHLVDELKATAGAYAAQSKDVVKTDGSTTFNGWVMGFNLELAP